VPYASHLGAHERSLGIKFLLWIALASTAVTVISSCIQLWYEYNSARSAIHKKINLMGESYSNILSQSIWNLDEKALKVHLTSLLVYPEIVYAGVKSDLQDAIYTDNNPDDLNKLELFDFQIHHFGIDKRVIGKLKIYVSYDPLIDEIINKGTFILIRQFFDLFLFSIIVLLVFEFLVSRNLRKMTQYAQKIDFNSLSEPLVLNNRSLNMRDEIDSVVESINKMRENLLIDVHNRIEAERSITESENRFKRITEGANDGLWEYSLDGTYSFFSDQYKQMLSWEHIPDDQIRHFWERNLHPADKYRVLDALENHFQKNDSFDIEYRILTGVGEYKWIKSKGKVHLDDDGNIRYFSGSIMDISTLKKVNEEILLAKTEVENYSKQLELVNRMASELGQSKSMQEILNISHRYLTLSLKDDLLTIYLYQSSEKMFEIFTFKNHNDMIYDLRYFPLESSMIGQTISENKIRFIPNFDMVNMVDLLQIHKRGMKSGVSIPLISSRETIGVLQIASKHYNAFTNYDTRILKQIGSLIGINIERKSYEEQLVKNEYQLKSLFDSTTNIIYSVNKEGQYLSFNSKYQEVIMAFYGLNVKVGTKLEDVYIDFPHERIQVFENLNKALNGERLYVVEKIGNDDVGYFYFDSFYNPIIAEDGSVSGASIFSNDITEKRLAEEELVKVQTRLEEAQKIARIGNFEWNVAQDQLWCSNEISRIFGIDFNYEDLTIETLFNKIISDDLQDLKELIRSQIDRFRLELRVNIKSELRTILFIASNQYDLDGNHLICQGTVQDITENKIQEQHKIEKEIAEQKNKHKDEFLANMSHEIRSPLNAIVGFSQILLTQSSKMDLPIDFREHLDHIKLSGQNLSELINNILDLSKIEAGKITYSYETINFKQLFQGIYHINKAKAIENGILFQYDISEKIPVYIVADRTKLNQILMNLVSNAIKFTSKEKEVKMTAHLNDDRIVLKVADQGIGIEKDRLPYVFEAFEQADNSITRNYGGTGLGLAITKKLVESLQGTIHVWSEPEKGSVFEVEIPFEISQNEVEDKKSFALNRIRFDKNSRILLVEDNLLNQELMLSFFKELNLEISIAQDGKKGVEMAEALLPDLILMDMHMPVMDGMQATQYIKSNLKTSSIPIVAISANAFTEQQKKVLELGVSDYVTKPVDFSKLMVILEKYLKKDKYQPIENISKIPMPIDLEKEIINMIISLEFIPIFMTDQLMQVVDNIFALSKDYTFKFKDELDQIKRYIYAGDEELMEELIKQISSKFGQA
jgi:PAS domain S-box-containing protein